MRCVKDGYKMTELGEIPVDWEVKQLGQITNINPEGLSNKTPKDTKINYIDIESVSTGRIKDYKQYIFEEVPSRARRIVKKNDVIISTVRPYLKAFAVVKEDIENLVCSTGFAVIRCDKSHDYRYVYQYTLSDAYIEQLKNKMVGSSYPAVNSSDIQVSLIPVPPLPEQQKIADILSTVDEQIDNVDQLIEKTNELKKGLMQQLLIKGIGHTEFKETEVGIIPKEWEVKKLEDVCKCVTIGLVKSMTKNYVDKGIPLIRNSDIKENYINCIDMINLDVAFAANNEDKRLQLGDVVTVHTGDICTSAVVEENLVGAHGFATLHSTVDSAIINNYYLSWYLNSNIAKIQAYSFSTGDGRNNLNLKDFTKLLITVPNTINEQLKIINILNTVHQRIDKLMGKKIKLQELKLGLMQQLLTGKIRVTTNK